MSDGNSDYHKAAPCTTDNSASAAQAEAKAAASSSDGKSGQGGA